MRVLTQHNDEIERLIQERRQQINELENELIKLDDLLMNSELLTRQPFPLIRHPSVNF